jgi:D-hexose-6-phosphate mutarotase
LTPVALNNLYWKADESNAEYGYSWANLTDPAGDYNGYKWEAKRINIKSSGAYLDYLYKRAGYFEDRFFDGLTFEFAVENPLKRKDTTHLEAYKRYYRIGDTVVIKLSRLDKATYDFFYKKSTQL